MTAHTRVRVVLVFVAIAAVAVIVAAYLHERKESDATADTTPVADASVDARAAKGTKGAKGTTAKKKGTRGGKTRVISAPPSRPAAPNNREAPSPGPDPGRDPVPAPDPYPDPDPDPDPSPAPGRPKRRPGPSGPSGPSYESVLGSNNQQVTIGAKNGPDLTDAQLSAPMNDGSFIDDCDTPDDMGVTVKVAIRSGRAVGVTVSTSPPSREVAGCIEHYVRGLSWPVSPKLDTLVTTY